MHRASDEWKENIRNINEQKLNKKIARLLSKFAQLINISE